MPAMIKSGTIGGFYCGGVFLLLLAGCGQGIRPTVTAPERTAYKEKMGISANYPGIGLRRSIAMESDPSNWFVMEGRGQFLQGAWNGGARLVFSRMYWRTTALYAGFEGNYFKVPGGVSTMHGEGFELFIGAEKYIIPRLSAQFDIGPAYIYTHASRGDLPGQGFLDCLMFVADFSITYYFWLK